MSLLISVFKELFFDRKRPGMPTDGEPAYSVSQEEEFGNHMQLARAAFPGEMYEGWLKWFHQKLQPSVYVEIGIETGKTLAYARPPSLAVGIDPAYNISCEMFAETKLFKETSDEFFRRPNNLEILQHRTVDLAFIDGLHTFDQALKDFIHLERLSGPDSVILFHDVQPVVPETADRSRHTIFWVGDTWKVMVILKKFRPDLKVISIPTYPSGLGVVTNLNPSSTVLNSKYDSIVAEAMEYELTPYLQSLKEDASAVVNDFSAVARHLDPNRKWR